MLTMVVSTTAMNEARHNTKSAKPFGGVTSEPTVDGCFLFRYSCTRSYPPNRSDPFLIGGQLLEP
jgi:hypothetical protein